MSTASAPNTIGSEIDEALRAVASASADRASQALSRWFQKTVKLRCDGFERVSIHAATEAAGCAEAVVAATLMPLMGEVSGDLVMLIPEENALRLSDLLIGREMGSGTELGPLEQSSLQETGNILGTSFANALASAVGLNIMPGAPLFAHDLGFAVIEPVLAEQVERSDEAWIVRTEFSLDGEQMDWRLVLLLSCESLERIRVAFAAQRRQRNALHALGANAAQQASFSLSRWLGRSIRLTATGFRMAPLASVSRSMDEAGPAVALNMPLDGGFRGNCLMFIPLDCAPKLGAILVGRECVNVESFDEMTLSCLRETMNIVGCSFANALATWLSVPVEPQPPQLCVDIPGAVLECVVAEQAASADEILLSNAKFELDGADVNCSFFLLPSPDSCGLITSTGR